MRIRVWVFTVDWMVELLSSSTTWKSLYTVDFSSDGRAVHPRHVLDTHRRVERANHLPVRVSPMSSQTICGHASCRDWRGRAGAGQMRAR